MQVWNRGFRLTWLGHSTFELVTRTGTTVLFDPWLAGNPKFPASRAPQARLDVIALSHAHGDHSRDVIELATHFACPVVCAYEASLFLEAKGVTTCAGMGKGGTQRVAGLAFTMVHAVHSSCFEDAGQIVDHPRLLGPFLLGQAGVGQMGPNLVQTDRYGAGM